MKLNIDKFKKIRTEKDHTVLRHPDGHEIRVLHKPLSKDIKSQLDALPHCADGGYIEESEEPSNTPLRKANRDLIGSKTIKERTEDYNKVSAAIPNVERVDVYGSGYADGGEVSATSDSISGAFKKAFKTPQPNPSPTPSKEDEYESIRKQNRANFGYADGGQVQQDPVKTQQAQDSLRKAFHFEGGGQPVIQGDEQPVTASKLESIYGPEDAAAQSVVNSLPEEQLSKEADSIPDPSHAHLSEAIKNLSQKYVPQSAPIAPAEAVEDKAEPPSPSQPGSVASLQPSAPNMPPTAQGTLAEQAQQNVEQQNKAEMSSAQNTESTLNNESNIQGQNAKQLQDLHQKYQDIGNQIHQKYDQLADEVHSGKIDPNQWWNSKSTGSKILTGIGMLFAGAGGGVSGHPEMVSKVIDGAIERDIDAQKANLNNKNTLLSKYMEIYNDLPQAEAAARLTMSAAVEGLMSQQATKLGSANAINLAKESILARRQQLLPQLEGLAKGQVMGQMYKDMSKSQPINGGSQEDAYQQQMQRMRILNPDLGKDMENKYLPGVGAARVPVPDKLREELSTRKDLSDKLAQLELFTKQHSGTVLDRAIVNQGKAMAAQVQDAYRTAHQQGVFKESEKNFVNSILNSDPTSFGANIRTLPGYRQARKFNDDTVKQYYKSYGIRPFQQQESGGQNAAAMEWLKANPNDPRAAAVKQKLGM